MRGRVDRLKRDAMPKYIVKFKETYMPRPVERVCTALSEDVVKKVYALDSQDIVWYKIEEVKG